MQSHSLNPELRLNLLEEQLCMYRRFLLFSVYYKNTKAVLGDLDIQVLLPRFSLTHSQENVPLTGPQFCGSALFLALCILLSSVLFLNNVWKESKKNWMRVEVMPINILGEGI